MNVNGLRAAVRKGMRAWVARCGPDVVALQEVRAPDDLVPGLVHEAFGPDWQVVHAEGATAGRAGVAVASRLPILEVRRGERVGAFAGTGRWIEADVGVDGARVGLDPPGLRTDVLTVVSVYVHTGDTGDPDRMAEKLAFLRAMTRRMNQLRRGGRRVVVAGDLNVAHDERDIKNWRGNVGRAGFLPEERAVLDRWYLRHGWVDVGRRFGGDGPGPYTWWSYRGRAYDNDAGWRIDHQIASPGLAPAVKDCWVDRSESYADRWSDHAPLVATYLL